MRTGSSKKFWKLASKIFISIALLFWLLSKAELYQMVNQWRGVNWLFLVPIALVVYCIGIGIDAWRWLIILKRQNIILPIWSLALIYMKGAFWGTFLPGGVSGDVYRIYSLASLTGQKPQSISSVLIERGTGIFCLLVLSMAALSYSIVTMKNSVFAPLVIPVFLITFLFGGGGLASILLFRSKFFNSSQIRLLMWVRFKTFAATVPPYFSKTYDTAKIFLLSMLFQIIIVLWSYIVSKALHYRLPFDVICVTVPLILLVAMLPFSINGIGVREAAHVFFLGPFGLSVSEAVSFSLLSFSIFAAMRILSGVVFLFDFEKQILE